MDGSSCTNKGTNTKVISKDSSCSSGVDGSTTICDNGPIISMGSDPGKNTNAVFGYGMYSARWLVIWSALWLASKPARRENTKYHYWTSNFEVHTLTNNSKDTNYSLK